MVKVDIGKKSRKSVSKLRNGGDIRRLQKQKNLRSIAKARAVPNQNNSWRNAT